MFVVAAHVYPPKMQCFSFSDCADQDLEKVATTTQIWMKLFNFNVHCFSYSDCADQDLVKGGSKENRPLYNISTYVVFCYKKRIWSI